MSADRFDGVSPYKGNPIDITDAGSAPWMKEPPTEPGYYHIMCDEGGNEVLLVSVIEVNGEILVEDPIIGTYPMDYYHFNLCNPEWRKI